MIWLIGNKGMLGTDVESSLREQGYELLASDRETDITDYNTLKEFSSGKKIDWIINCSAYTAVDKAEDEPDAAYSINSLGVYNIARIAGELRSRLIHFSTDYVFPGDSEAAYTETDPTGPIGVYGMSKLEGEIRLAETLTEHYIIRISWLFGLHGGNFVYTMLRLMKEREELRVVADQWGSPTYTFDVAGLVLAIIRSGKESYGIYHFSNEGKTSWHHFSSEIYRQAMEKGLIRKEVLITPVTTDQYPTKAARPKNSYFSKDKIKREFGVSIRTWQEALQDFISRVS